MINVLRHFILDAIRYVTFRLPLGYGQVRGVYENFEQAIAAAPSRAKIGYNHQLLACEYKAHLNVCLHSTDYPMLFHLERILRKQPASFVLDFGGNVGIHYLQYQGYLDLQKVKWIVCDVPEIAAIGRETCAGIPNIEFLSDVAGMREARLNVFLASGSMQYVESANLLLPQLVDQGVRPEHILIDDLPVCGGERFVTLQNGGLVYYPQYVFNGGEFISAIERLGYELIDVWNTRASCLIPFHRGKSVVYKGLYFSRARLEDSRGREFGSRRLYALEEYQRR